MRAVIAAALAALFVLSAHIAWAAGNAELKGMEAVSGAAATRVYLNLSAEPAFGVTAPSGDTIIVELDDTSISGAAQRRITPKSGPVESIEASQAAGRKTRVVIRTSGEAGYRVTTEEKGTFILALEVSPSMAESASEGAGAARRTLPAPHGYLKFESAVRTSGERFTKARTIAFIGLSGSLFEDARYFVSARGAYDAAYNLTDDYPPDVEADQRLELTLRDAYVDLSAGGWDLRLGRQQIVWGEAVGLFFADAVNAKDLRESVLPDFEYMRIPQWAALAEYSSEGFHLDLVWIPVVEVNKVGLQGSEFPAAVPVPVGVTAASTGEKEPPSTLESSELGARASLLVDGWDLSIFHLYTWDKFPVNYRTVTSPTLYTFSPAHARMNVTGLTVAKEIRDIILKGEFVYTAGRNFSVLDPGDPDGVVQKDFLDYLVGADYTFLGRIDANLQFMQRVIFGFDERIFREERVRTTASLRLKASFHEDTVEPEILVITSLQTTDMLLRPRVNLRLRDDLQARVGLDIFEGSPEGVFGQYDGSDRAYAEMRYDF